MQRTHRFIHGTIIRVTAITLIIAFVIAGLGLSRSESAGKRADGKKVLLITSYRPEHPFYTLFIDGVKSHLAEESTMEFRVFHESLDLVRFTLDDDFFLDLATILQKKYANTLPDIIIVNGEPAANFMLRYGSVIFGDIPVVVAIYNETQIAYQPLPTNYTFITTPIDVSKNLQLILDSRPATQKIYVVIGETPTQRDIYEEISQRLTAFAEGVEIIYLNRQPFPAILERIRQLKDPAAILYIAFGKDVQGNTFVPDEVIKVICDESQVPVFGIGETYLGSGCVGGYMLNNASLVQQVVEKALDILHGTNEQGGQAEILDIGRYMFDWHALQRWEIDENELPAGSIIKNAPTNLWDRYKGYIIGGILLLLLQSFLIVLLLVNRKKRQRVERELTRLDELYLVGEMAAGIGHEIRNPLTIVRGYLQLLGQKPQLQAQKEILHLMIDEIDRANGIITEFLKLAKNKAIQPSLHQINDIVQSLLPILTAEANLRGNEIVFIPGDVPEVLADEKEIRQVILNLVMNGLESMQGNGVLTIEVSRDKDKVVISIHDQGPGMPDEISQKIGMPFFTTKPNGTGLGLSICFAIAERHGARLTFNTGPEGTTFYFAFPLE